MLPIVLPEMVLSVECLKFSTNDDMLCTNGDWPYMTYRRLGRVEGATQVRTPIHANMSILENFAYHRRFLMYKGVLMPDSLLNPIHSSDLDIVTQDYRE